MANIENIKKSILDTKIDLLVISHYHEDHINGLEYLFKNFDIKRMLMPYLDLTEKIETFIDADVKNTNNDFYKDFCIDPNKALKDNFGKSTEIIFVNPLKQLNDFLLFHMLQTFFFPL